LTADVRILGFRCGDISIPALAITVLNFRQTLVIRWLRDRQAERRIFCATMAGLSHGEKKPATLPRAGRLKKAIHTSI
jgi:hypothetical protein